MATDAFVAFFVLTVGVAIEFCLQRSVVRSRQGNTSPSPPGGVETRCYLKWKRGWADRPIHGHQAIQHPGVTACPPACLSSVIYTIAMIWYSQIKTICIS